MKATGRNYARRLFALMLGLVMMFTLVIPVPVQAAGTSSQSDSQIELKVGETKTLKVSGLQVKWKSSNEEVAEVSGKGVVTAVSEGTATVTATYKTFWGFLFGTSSKKDYQVTVTADEGAVDEPGTSEGRTVLLIGESVSLSPSVTGRTTWKSSDTDVAEVDDGVVTGVGEGQAVITATTKTGGFHFLFFSWGAKTTTDKFEVEVLKPDDEVTYYNVNFESNGGSKIESQSVEEGQSAVKPEDPVKDGCVFAGWYSDEALSVEYSFEEPVVSDLVLYAKWEESVVCYLVNFESNGAAEIESQSVAAGESVSCPEDPVKEGYVFSGWYEDSALTVPFDFDSPVTSDLTLYAKWIVEDDNLTDDIIDLGDIAAMVSSGKIEVIYDETGQIQTIDGTFTDQTVSSAEEAADVLNHASGLFSESFYADASDITCQTAGAGAEDEESFYRYAPTRNGVMVLGSQIILSTDSSSRVTGLSCSYNEDIEYVNTTPDISQESAVSSAVEAVMEDEEVNAFLESLPEYSEHASEIRAEFKAALSADAVLMIYAADADTDPALVYAVTVTRYDFTEKDDDTDLEEDAVEGVSGAPVLDRTYYVAANDWEAGNIVRVTNNSEGWSGVTLKGIDLLNQTRTIIGQEQDGYYRLKDTTRNLTTYKTAKTGFLWWTQYQLPGNIAKSTSFFGNQRMEMAAVSAHANMSEVYDYYYNVLGRKSFDGNSAAVKVSYDYGSNYKNAYWTAAGQQFVFGSGWDYVAAKDIVAHEYTHAVINYVVGNGYDTTLTYMGETGALNEAYADIMGSLIEGKSGTDLWLIGEDCGDIMRSMENPEAYGQPDHYSALSDEEWLSSLNQYKDRDNEGVHIFCGVYCHAVYRMVTDSRCSDVSNDLWAKVFYRSLYRLTTDADFLDGRGAVISSAKALGFDSSKQQAIKDAFDAVGITEPDAVRIVLTWGELPYDLDSHLVGPGVNGERFHVYYSQRSYYQDGSYSSSGSLYAVDLDYDDTTSYGPEVTTIHTLTPGTYYFYVHDYTNGSSGTSTQMAASGATVKVYRGSGNTEIASYHVDPSSMGTYWNVFELNIDGDGEVSLTEINTYGSSPTLE